MKCPAFARYVRVDQIIECYEVSRETRKALLEAMPDAYGGEGPGEDSWPEPDSSRDAPYKLNRCWSKLPLEAQEDIVRAYEKERG